ncbi:serine/threonine-protein kinase [Kitasatospora sp. NPDC058162]|uniref:serine/threonine-protein kinase n=1 Tax=Kitasatospora sp. NPDC058162 TaxID=3346362 RepID=UPI0036DE7557
MTRMQEHTVGDVVADRFELLARLGAGGMGTVWRARDLVLEREVALKQMRSADEDASRSAAARYRVLREARALARIDHPNVVSVHEILDQWPHPWLVMEVVEGRSLQEVLEDGPLAPGRAARIGLDVLGALDAAHAAGILHRDVKPGNVLIRPDGSAVLTDFGIATLQGSQTLTAPGDIIGSPEYMAPERLRGSVAGPASDLWSLGVLLYVCVEGANPLQRDSVWETMRAICDEQLPSPPKAGPLATAIDALLAHDPEGRPDAPRLAAMLRAVAGDDGPEAMSAAETVVVDRGTAAAVSEVRTAVVGHPPVLVPTPTLLEAPGQGAVAAGRAARVPTPRGDVRAPRRRRRLTLGLAAVAVVAVVASAVAFALPGSDGTAGDTQPTPVAEAHGSWIAQLAQIPHTTDPDERDQELTALQQQVPGASLVDSDNWASLPSGYWIVRAPGEFANGYDALAYCAKATEEQCSGRYLSDNSADRAYHCQAQPAPNPVACRRLDDHASPAATTVKKS